MSSIVAIGGGEITDAETDAIDEQIVASVDTATPTALFVPTASGDAEGYCETFREYYGETLGCDIAVLRLVDSDPSQAEIESQFSDADIITSVAETRGSCSMCGGHVKSWACFDRRGSRARC